MEMIKLKEQFRNPLVDSVNQKSESDEKPMTFEEAWIDAGLDKLKTNQTKIDTVQPKPRGQGLRRF